MKGPSLVRAVVWQTKRAANAASGAEGPCFEQCPAAAGLVQVGAIVMVTVVGFCCWSPIEAFLSMFLCSGFVSNIQGCPPSGFSQRDGPPKSLRRNRDYMRLSKVRDRFWCSR